MKKRSEIRWALLLPTLVPVFGAMPTIAEAGGTVAPPLPERHFNGSPNPPAPDTPISILNHTCTVDADCADQGSGVSGNERCLTGADGVSHCYVPKVRVVSVQANPANNGIAHSLRVQWFNGSTGTYQTLGFVRALPLGGTGIPAPHPIVPTATPALDDQIDWNAEYPLVHIAGCGIAPTELYRVQSLAAGDDPNVESNYSDPIELPTSIRWGDVKGPPILFNPVVFGGPDNVTNLDDVIGSLHIIHGLQTLPSMWPDVEGGGQNGINNVINLNDTFAIVGAINDPYPFPAPCTPGCLCP